MKNNFYLSLVLAILLSSINIQANAQVPKINFTYDASGNRVIRNYTAFKLMNNSSSNDPEAEQIASQFGINVYPNPLMDGNNVTVAVTTAKNSEGDEATIYVLDNKGQMLFSQKQSTASPSQVDLSTYSAGIYYIKVAIKKEQLFYRIAKVK